MLLLLRGPAGFARLAHVSIYSGYLMVLAVIAQMSCLHIPALRWPALLVNVLLFSAFLYQNRSSTGLIIATSGAFLNFLVMLVNGAAMPVTSTSYASLTGRFVAAHTIVMGSKDTIMDAADGHLFWLADRLTLPGILHSVAVWSIGDAIIVIGICIFLVQNTKETSTCSPINLLVQ